MSLPHFIIAGERRSGSTMLYEVLKKHPDIDMHSQSDMDFFIEKELFKLNPVEDDQVTDWSNYSNINLYKSLFENPDKEKKTGHKDADLLWWRNAHSRLSKNLKETKYIFILRNPVNRAQSQYWNEVRKGREKYSFESVIFDRNISTHWEKLHLDYLQRGCYVNSLKHFFKYISKDKCHIVILEKLIHNWDLEIESILRFLEINPEKGKQLKKLKSNEEEVLVLNDRYKSLHTFIKTYDRAVNFLIRKFVHNKHKKKKLQAYFLKMGKVSRRKDEPINSYILKKLKSYYKPYNRELEKFLNIDIPEWG